MDLFESTVCREGTGNMKGERERRMPEGSVSLWGAEMDYPTAPCVRRALAAFAEKGIYGFTLPSKEYLETLCHWMSTIRHADVSPDWIVPTQGTLSSFCTAMRAFTNEGDNVVIQSPYYSRYRNAVERNGRNLVLNPMKEENGVYTLDFSDLEARLSEPRSRLLILVNPHNPTGRVFSEEELERIGVLAERYCVTVFCDEIFAETVQPGYSFRPCATIVPRAITAFSLGKSFNFTGVSQANLLIPNPQMRETYFKQRNRDHFGSIDPFFYCAVMAAYTEDGAAWLKAMNAHTAENYALLARILTEKLPLLNLSPLEGTFVAWLDCRRLGLTDESLQRFMEEDALVYGDPGIEYGAPGFYRWNLATPSENIQRAANQMADAWMRRIRA